MEQHFKLDFRCRCARGPVKTRGRNTLGIIAVALRRRGSQLARGAAQSSLASRLRFCAVAVSSTSSLTCALRKSYPDVMVVQPGQDRDDYNDPGPLHCPT